MSGEVIDRQTGKTVALNDLSQGKYEVTVDVGQSFATRRDATVKSLTNILAMVPPATPKHDMLTSMILDNMDGEGLDDLKDYNRKQLLMSGVVKPRTPEEEQMVAQAQAEQQSQPNPEVIAAQGVYLQGQAELTREENRRLEIQIEAAKVEGQNQLNAAKIADIFNSMDLNKRKEFREFMSMFSSLQQQQGDNARANAELMLKTSAQSHSQNMDFTNSMQPPKQQTEQ